LGALTARYRWFALIYIIGMFFVLPSLFVVLTFIDTKGIAMYTVLALMVLLIVTIVSLNLLQDNLKTKNKLPSVLQDWDFLPEPLRSLEPYDR
jgi:sodium-dependent phosphate cotransporter